MDSTQDVIPLVDLRAQYLAYAHEFEQAMASVVTECAFIGNGGNRFVGAFEAAFASYIGTDHCVACGNGTDALEILLEAAGIGPGDEVLVPAVSWIATSEAVSTRGATPVFVDILPDEYSMDPAGAAAALTPRTRAMIPVHLYGLPARMTELLALARRAGLFVLEDCAQAHGARYHGRNIGMIGDAAAFSFFPSKNLGAWGDAGAMLTSDDALARRARMIAQHGQADRKHGHLIEGRNSRLDGLQAAVLGVKLPYLESWIERRRELARRYRALLSGLAVRCQAEPDEMRHAYHLFVIQTDARDAMAAALAADGISTAVQYPCPLPLLPAYARFAHRPEEFPVAQALTSRALSLPLYPELTDAQQQRVTDAVRRAMETHTA